MIRHIQGADQAPANPLLILGPSFSGSLQSLHEEVSKSDTARRTAYIYSGSVTAAGSIHWLEAHRGSTHHFACFQENDDYTQAEFVAFAQSRGYKKEEIAVLAEDETVYGAIAPEQVAAHGEEDGVTHLHFPREISFFRSAYQKEVAAQQPAAKTSGAKRRTYIARTRWIDLSLGYYFDAPNDARTFAYPGFNTL
jgi:hypothetical protein